MILHLTLKKKWFDMILSGFKKEEYREIKEYWWIRLVQCGEIAEWKMLLAKNFEKIIFTNGYGKNAPSFEIECLGIEIRKGKTEWGAEKGKEYFVLKLGAIMENHN